MKDSELYRGENKVLHVISASKRTKQQKIHLDNRSLYVIMVPAGRRVARLTSTPRPCLVPHTHKSASSPHSPVARRSCSTGTWAVQSSGLECQLWHPAHKEAEQCSIRSTQDLIRIMAQEIKDYLPLGGEEPEGNCSTWAANRSTVG